MENNKKNKQSGYNSVAWQNECQFLVVGVITVVVVGVVNRLVNRKTIKKGIGAKSYKAYTMYNLPGCIVTNFPVHLGNAIRILDGLPNSTRWETSVKSGGLDVLGVLLVVLVVLVVLLVLLGVLLLVHGLLHGQ